MRKVRCYECGKTYDYDTDDFCPKCGAFNQPPKSTTIDANGAVIRVELYEAESLGIKTPEDIESLELSVTTVDENWETRTESDTIVLQLEK